MFMWDSKKHLQTMIQKRGEKGGEVLSSAPLNPEIVKDEDGEINPHHIAAQDVLSAIHEKSAEKYMHAMGNFIDLHMSKDSNEPDPKD